MVVRSAETEGMPNEADISRGSDHFHGDIILAVVVEEMAARNRNSTGRNSGRSEI